VPSRIRRTDDGGVEAAVPLASLVTALNAGPNMSIGSGGAI
jgi:hypothetical protein